MSIVQELRRRQDVNGYLSRADLSAVAAALDVPLYRVQQVASFFPHFRTTPPPVVQLQVCRDISCHLRGAPDLTAALKEACAARYSGPQVAVEEVSCLGRCDRAPAACLTAPATHHGVTTRVGHVFARRPANDLLGLVDQALKGKIPAPDSDARYQVNTNRPWAVDPYAGDQAPPPFEAVRRYKADPRPEVLLQALETAELRGMGGAGEPASKKWSDVRRAKGATKYVVCNADESEPGTFKDRELLLRAPHVVIEGMILGGLVTGARQGYVYVRHEYEEQVESVERAIDAARTAGVCGPKTIGTPFEFDLTTFVSPGGYICGEQGALIEAMQDNRSEPRNRPPQLSTNGLWDMPTLLNNVETFAWVPVIALRGGQWYADQGANGCKGRRFFSISGDLPYPGVYEVPIGSTLRDLLENHAIRAPVTDQLKALAPSGPSGGALPRLIPVATLPGRVREGLPAGTTHRDLLDLPLDLQRFRDYGLMLGAGLVVYGPGADLVSQAVNATAFFRNESCGKCTPCRIGSQKMVEIGTDLAAGRYDAGQLAAQAGLIKELTFTLEMTSICGLGTSVPAPLSTLLKYFPDEARQRLRGPEAPARRPVPEK